MGFVRGCRKVLNQLDQLPKILALFCHFCNYGWKKYSFKLENANFHDHCTFLKNYLTEPYQRKV